MQGRSILPWLGPSVSGILRAMLIDAHNHPNWHGHDADRLLANMEEHGIDQMWLFSWEVPATDYNPSYHAVLPPGGVGIPLEDVLNVGRAAPDRFVLGYMPDVKRPDAIDRIKAAVEIHGIRVASELKQRVLFDDPDALDIYHFCGEQKLPITIHLDYPIPTGHRYPRPNWWYGGSLDSFERAVGACPETIFIGHAPGFWGHISGDDRCMTEAYPEGPVKPGGRVLHPAGHLSQPVRRPVGRLRPDGHLPRSGIRQAVPDPLPGSPAVRPRLHRRPPDGVPAEPEPGAGGVRQDRLSQRPAPARGRGVALRFTKPGRGPSALRSGSDQLNTPCRSLPMSCSTSRSPASVEARCRGSRRQAVLVAWSAIAGWPPRHRASRPGPCQSSGRCVRRDRIGLASV